MRALSRVAQAYLLLVLVGAVAAAAACGFVAGPLAPDLPLLAVLVVAGAVAQQLEVNAPNHRGYTGTLVVLAFAALLLHPLAAAAVAVLPFLVEQLRHPKPWHIATFNMASHVLAVVAAERTLVLLDGRSGWLDGSWQGAGAVLAAVVVLLVVNHGTLGVVLKLARGVGWRESGLWGVEGLLTDGCLLGGGVVLAALWVLGPPLLLFAVAPVYLLQRSLQVEALTVASQTDGKTGLLNATRWKELASSELVGADGRRPTTVLVADLDLLRDINNRWGHLAGDVVLAGIADVLREVMRPGDHPARFGGEEFVVLLPGTDEASGLAVAERIRATLAARLFDVGSEDGPLHASVSVGVATSDGGSDLTSLLHCADLALYEAKAAGRNRVAAHAR